MFQTILHEYMVLPLSFHRKLKVVFSSINMELQLHCVSMPNQMFRLTLWHLSVRKRIFKAREFIYICVYIHTQRTSWNSMVSLSLSQSSYGAHKYLKWPVHLHVQWSITKTGPVGISEHLHCLPVMMSIHQFKPLSNQTSVYTLTSFHCSYIYDDYF